jgi:four helix bundle protein
MLRIYDVVLETLRAMKPVVAKIAEHDADLARQLRRAATSVLLNLAEGTGCRAGTRRQRYHDALGSARESAACLDAADALGYCAIDPALRDRLERIAATLTNLTR